jgi:LysM repeat protein
MVAENYMTQAQVTALADANGFSSAAAKIAGAIAMTETLTFLNGKQYCDFAQVGDKNLANDVWGYSYSAWQIRSLRADKGTGSFRDEDALQASYAFAARAAFDIYKNAGYKWTPWSTYNSGAYLGFLLDTPEAQVPAGSYRVTGGDTLTRIGNKTGYAWRDIAAVNRIKDPYVIYPGQVLLLPDFPHTVVYRETLTSIAAKYGNDLTAQKLADYNDIAIDSKLLVGTVLKVPRL